MYGDETYGQPMATTASYGYDDPTSGNNGKGRRTSSLLSAGGYRSSYRYDNRGRVLQDDEVIGGTSYGTSYTYDALDRTRTMTYHGGEVVSFGYNARTLLSSMSGQATYIASISYDALGKPLDVANGAGVTAQYRYDPNHFRLSTLAFSGAGAPNLAFGYSYDQVGNIQTIAQNGIVTTFGYDWADRLTSASGGYSASYSYDSIGDLLGKTEGASSKTLGYNLATRPKHAPKTVNGVAQTYDANGNLLSDGMRTFTYDAENRLTTVVSGTITIQFVYDPDGKRIKKIENGQTTVYVGKHFEWNLSTGVVTKYYAALGQPVAMWQSNVGTTYLHRDRSRPPGQHCGHGQYDEPELLALWSLTIKCGRHPD